jgi:hypothetical protein
LHLAFVSLYLASRYKDGKPGSYNLQGKGRPFAERRPFEFYLLGNDCVLMFNPKNDENPDAPVPMIFCPRATNFGGSQVIHLADGQDLLNADIHVNDPLPARQITVR